MKKIEELHQKDINYSKSGNIEGLLELWTADGVLILPDIEPVVGLENIKKFLHASVDSEIVIIQYSFNFHEIKIIDEYAYEWGTYDHKYRIKPSEEIVQDTGKIFRLLKMENGEWKVKMAIGLK